MRHKPQAIYSKQLALQTPKPETERERPKSSTILTHRVAPPSVLRPRVRRCTRRLLAGSLPSPFHPCAASRRRALFVSPLPHTTERLHFAAVSVCPLHQYDDERRSPCPPIQNADLQLGILFFVMKFLVCPQVAVSVYQ